MSDEVQYPQFSAEGLPLTYVPDPQKADGKPVDSQWKQPVRTATNGAITLSGLQTVNGIALMEGDRVLVKDQVDPAEDGIWIASSYDWYRAPDMKYWPQFVSAVVAVEENAGVGEEVWITSVAADGTVGTTPVYWVTVSSATGTIPTFTPLRALVTNAVGEPAASPTTAQEIAFVSGVTSAIQPQFAAVNNLASSAFSIAVLGTNAAASAANYAASAYQLAQVGTNTGTAAYQLAQTGSNTAYDAYQIAVAGTNIGSLAYTVATALGDKYVRTTRFASIGAGTGGTVTLPANSTVVLDDFGGGVDAVITTISAGRPTFSHAFTAAGDIVTTSFDAGGNYTLSGAPSAYPVALVYRVRQKLSDFDSTSSDIIGDYDVEGVDSIQGTPDQVYINGSTTPQFGVAVFSTPQDIAQTSAVTFGSVFASGSVFTPYAGITELGVTHAHFVATGGTIARDVGCLRWSDYDSTLEVDLYGTSVTLQIGQETLVYARNNSGRDVLNGEAVYISGATGERPNFKPASNTTRSQSRGCVGLTTEYIARNAVGFVTVRGLVRGLDTSTTRFPGVTEGRPVFLGTNGGLTTVPPTPPASTVFIGIIVTVNANTGIIWVDTRATDALSELQDVYVPTRTAGDTIVYNGTIWVNKSPFSGSNATAGTITADPSSVILADCTNGSVVVSLPNPTTSRNYSCYVKKVDSTGSYVYVRPVSGYTLDGDTEKFFNVQNTAIHVFSNGTNWFIL